MIKIKKRKLSTYRLGLAESGMATVANETVNAVAKDLEEKFEGKTCEKCDEDSTLILIAEKKERVRIDKSDFCCDEFANSIEINIFNEKNMD